MLLIQLSLKTFLLLVLGCLVTAKSATQTSSGSCRFLTGDNIALISSVDKTLCCTLTSKSDLLKQFATLV